MTFYDFINDKSGNPRKMEFQHLLSWLPDFDSNDSAQVMCEKAKAYTAELITDIESQYAEEHH